MLGAVPIGHGVEALLIVELRLSKNCSTSLGECIPDFGPVHAWNGGGERPRAETGGFS